MQKHPSDIFAKDVLKNKINKIKKDNFYNIVNKNIKNFVKIIEVKSIGLKIDKGYNINYEKTLLLIIFRKIFGLSVIEIGKFLEAL